MAAPMRRMLSGYPRNAIWGLRGGCIHSRREVSPLVTPRRNMAVVDYYREKYLNWKNFRLKMKNELIESRVDYWGPELAAAHWLLFHNNAAIQFTNGQWYMKNRKGKYYLPRDKVKGEFIMSIDVPNAPITYEGMDNIVCLKHLKYLSLKGCPHIDDFCLARLHHFQDTLTHLNISRCPQITERGLATLHRLPKLERLNMKDLPKVENPELMAIMLEDVLPNLKMDVVSRHVRRHLDFMTYVESKSRGKETRMKGDDKNMTHTERTESKPQNQGKESVAT